MSHRYVTVTVETRAGEHDIAGEESHRDLQLRPRTGRF